MTEETKKKISDHHKLFGIKPPSRKGKKFSPETIKQMSDIKKGKKQTKETRRKISEAVIGNKNWLGKKHTDEVKKRMSEAHKGKIVTNETKKRMSESKIGDKCCAWKGGVTPINQKIRNSFEIKLWKKACLERDNFTCQKSGERGGKLNVHHINNFAEFPELRTSIENGITLRREAHIDFHNIYGRKNNTREQLEEFIQNN